ncbi:MAG: GGDEF domain-containing protein [Eubacterium sp.]|nr:GGDEF domain-containing protein [Eubacterium sp.]
MNTSPQYYFDQAIEPFYIAFLAVCLVISAQIYSRIYSSIGRENEIKALKRIIWVYVIYTAENMLWVILSFHTSLYKFITFIEYTDSGVLALFTYFWFLFAYSFLNDFSEKSTPVEIATALPFVTSAVITVSYLLNFAGILGRERFDSDLLYIMNTLLDSVYLVLAFILTLYRVLQEKYKTRRHHFLVLLRCIIYPAIGAGFSFFISYVPYIILSILPSIIEILIEMQNANIYTDALTQINNRYRINEYLEKHWERCSEDHPMAIYMIDVDKFKKINDTYGHLTGDKALVAVADAMRDFATEGMIIGRFGGDEFILLDSGNHDPEQLMQGLRKNIADISDQRGFPFRLTISIGYAVCTSPEETIASVQDRADRELYIDKKR